MLEVISGSKSDLKKNPLISVNCCPMSPLVISGDTARSMLQFSAAGIPVKVLSMAIGGASTPASIFGVALATNVEIIGAITLIQTINPGAPVLYSSVSSVMDMRTSILAVGAPERSIINRFLANLATNYYKIPCVMGGLSTDSRYMDFQCGFEKTITTLPLLDYANMVSGMALLNSANTYSIEQLIYDAEIVSAMKKFKHNEGLSHGEEECELVKKVGPMGHFLLEDHTAMHFKDFWQPGFMNRTCEYPNDEEYAYVSDAMKATLGKYSKADSEILIDEKKRNEIEKIIKRHIKQSKQA
jgi:trimethylamine--corrinoid protein Co-methyltransferase